MNFEQLLAAAVENSPSLYWGIPHVIEEFLPEDVWEVEDEILDSGRWELYHRAVYRYQDRFWIVHYNEPATENQDWDQEYSLCEAVPVETIVTKYVPLV